MGVNVLLLNFFAAILVISPVSVWAGSELANETTEEQVTELDIAEEVEELDVEDHKEDIEFSKAEQARLAREEKQIKAKIQAVVSQKEKTKKAALNEKLKLVGIKTQTEKSNAGLKKLTKEQSRLEWELNQVRQKSAVAKTRAALKRQQLKDTRTRVSRMHQEISDRNREIKAAKRQQEQLIANIKAANKALAQAQKRAKELSLKNRKMAAKNRKLEKNLEQTEKRIQKTQKQVAKS